MDLPAPSSVRQSRDRSGPKLQRGFEDAYREHFSFVWRALVRLGVPWSEAEDAVQEVFVVAYRRWDRFEGRATRRTWLFAIARRVASHHRRTSDRRDRRKRAYGRSATAAVDGEQTAHAAHAASRLQDFLASLDPPKREVFLLADLEGFTGKEIARALGINANTAWSRLKAARSEFARTFGQRTAGPPKVVVDDVSPPPQARARVWALLMPKLALVPASTISGAAAGSAVGLAANIKAFGLVVILGGAALATTAATLDPAPPPAKADASHAPTTSTDEAAPKTPIDPPPPVLQRPDKLHAELAAASVAPIPRSQAPDTAIEPAPAEVPTPPEAPTRSGKPSTEEVELLHRAQSYLEQGRPLMTLLTLRQHKKRFPTGSLGLLRRVTRVEALCAANRRAQGIGEAYRLVREQHREPRLVQRMQKACGLRSLGSKGPLPDDSEPTHAATAADGPPALPELPSRSVRDAAPPPLDAAP